MSSLFDESVWLSRIDDSRSTDSQTLNNKLDGLEANNSQLVEALSLFCLIMFSLICLSSGCSELQDDTRPVMVCLQRQLENRSISGRERQFLSHVLEYLSCASSQVDIESWMITPYEVDFGHRIGMGGLYELTPKCTGTLLTGY